MKLQDCSLYAPPHTKMRSRRNRWTDITLNMTGLLFHHRMNRQPLWDRNQEYWDLKLFMTPGGKLVNNGTIPCVLVFRDCFRSAVKVSLYFELFLLAFLKRKEISSLQRGASTCPWNRCLTNIGERFDLKFGFRRRAHDTDVILKAFDSKNNLCRKIEWRWGPQWSCKAGTGLICPIPLKFE